MRSTGTNQTRGCRDWCLCLTCCSCTDNWYVSCFFYYFTFVASANVWVAVEARQQTTEEFPRLLVVVWGQRLMSYSVTSLLYLSFSFPFQNNSEKLHSVQNSESLTTVMGCELTKESQCCSRKWFSLLDVGKKTCTNFLSWLNSHSFTAIQFVFLLCMLQLQGLPQKTPLDGKVLQISP